LAARGLDLSRINRDFASAGDASLSSAELLQLLAACSSDPSGQHREAIACYLSASEGWDEALKALRGAFASDAAEAVRSGNAAQDKHNVNHRASEYLQWPALKPAGTDND
jgi:hypothetical protein